LVFWFLRHISIINRVTIDLIHLTLALFVVNIIQHSLRYSTTMFCHTEHLSQLPHTVSALSDSPLILRCPCM